MNNRRWVVPGALATLISVSTVARALAQATRQNSVELRTAASRGGLYRFADYSRTFRNRAVLDALYIGNPGQNEFFGGLGYQLKVTRSLTVTPLLYGVIGVENQELGVAAGLLALGTVGRWSVYGYLGHFRPLRGSISAYTFLDSFDVSRIAGAWEFGVSTGFFNIAGGWTIQAGPLLVRNDAAGAWRVSLRGGTNLEGRVVRTFSF